MAREFTFKITGFGEDRRAVVFNNYLTVEVHDTDLGDKEAEDSAFAEIYSQVAERVLGNRDDLAFLDFELIQEPFSRLEKSRLLSVKTFTLEEFIKRNKHDLTL